jgi:hypothetical protein
MKWSWPDFRLLSRKFTGGTEDTTKYLSRDSLCTDRIRNHHLSNVNQQLRCFNRPSWPQHNFSMHTLEKVLELSLISELHGRTCKLKCLILEIRIKDRLKHCHA